MAYPRQRVYLSIKAWFGFISHLVSGKLFNGNSLKEFQHAYAKLIGVADAITVPSGRQGLSDALSVLDLSEGAEILIPAFTYPAVPFVVEQLGYTIRFIDVDRNNFGIDIVALEKLLAGEHHIEAIIPTHLYGVPCDIEKIERLCKEQRIRIIEDCAHCGITEVNGRKTGTFSDIAYFSFETSKSINTLGGGMLTTSDKVLAQKLVVLQELNQKSQKNSIQHLLKRLLKSSFEALVTQPILFNIFIYPALRLVDKLSQADDVVSKQYVGKDITMEGRTMAYSNYQAWLGLQQLPLLAQVTSKRIHHANYLLNKLSHHLPCHTPVNETHQPNWLLFSVVVDDKESMASKLLACGVDTKRDYMRDCSQLFKAESADNKNENAAYIEQSLLHLPCYPELTEPQLEKISQQVIDCLASTH